MLFTAQDKPSSILLLHDPRPIEHGNTVLDGVNDVADDGEDDEEDYDYYCDHHVAFDHVCGVVTVIGGGVV